MFTGLVQGMGTVVRTRRVIGGWEVVVRAGVPLRRVRRGSSVSVDGACLTVVRRAGSRLTFVAVPETLSKTTLGEWRAGRRVNLEPALRWGDPLDGHWVLGHVDGTGRVLHRAVRHAGGEVRFRLRVPRGILRFLPEKGSVAVDGVSLTVASAERDTITLALIPETLRVTTLGRLRAGARVNLEVDPLARYVGRWLGRGTGRKTS